MWFAATALALACGATPHPNSLSSSRIVVAGERIVHELVVQRTSLLEVLPLDVDADGWISPAELAGARADVAAYLLAHYRFRADERNLEGAVRSLATAIPPSPFDEQWIEVVVDYAAAEPIAELAIEVSLFAETSPLHKDFAEITLNGAAPFMFTYSAGDATLRLGPDEIPPPRDLADWLGHGFEHIVTGWDHVAFLVALLVAATTLRSLVGVVTAFTVAHSVTLALAALEVIDVPARLVELVIALSIAYVAAGNLLHRLPRNLWIEAFLFGLVHGLGFAGFLSDSFAAEPAKLRALVGFNLGVELGQLGVVLVAALVLRLAPGERAVPGDPTQRWLAPRLVRLVASAVVCALGLWWFVERAWL